MSNLFKLIKTAIKEDAGENGENEGFNSALANILTVIGQQDGGVAAMFFSEEKLRAWDKCSKEERGRILADYLAYEIETEITFGVDEDKKDPEDDYDPETDLFRQYDAQPPELKAVCEKYETLFEEGEVDGYQLCRDFLNEVEKIGYTFEYYLDASPYNLRKKDSV